MAILAARDLLRGLAIGGAASLYNAGLPSFDAGAGAHFSSGGFSAKASASARQGRPSVRTGGGSMPFLRRFRRMFRRRRRRRYVRRRRRSYRGRGYKRGFFRSSRGRITRTNLSYQAVFPDSLHTKLTLTHWVHDTTSSGNVKEWQFFGNNAFSPLLNPFGSSKQPLYYDTLIGLYTYCRVDAIKMYFSFEPHNTATYVGYRIHQRAYGTTGSGYTTHQQFNEQPNVKSRYVPGALRGEHAIVGIGGYYKSKSLFRAGSLRNNPDFASTSTAAPTKLWSLQTAVTTNGASSQNLTGAYRWRLTFYCTFYERKFSQDV